MGVNIYYLFPGTTNKNLTQYLDSAVILINILRSDRKIGANFLDFQMMHLKMPTWVKADFAP